MKYRVPPEFPRLPIPGPLCGNEEGTWASSTIKERLPAIARRALLEDHLDTHSRSKIEALIREIPYSPLKPIDDLAAPDQDAWNQALQPHLGMNWLDAPWFVVETYFYRRIIQAIGYFESLARDVRIDPFKSQKEMGLLAAQKAMKGSCSSESFSNEDQVGDVLADLMLRVLWGNRADLSLWPVEEDPGHSNRHLVSGTDRVLVDQRAQAVQYLTGLKAEPGRLDFILDNVGVELMLDLCLVDFLLRRSLATKVVLHLKLHPTFVSDATIADYHQTLASWRDSSLKPIADFGSRLARYGRDQRIELAADPFWTSPLSMWEMPLSLKRSLSASKLVVGKGDANYRRLLGDRHWEYSTPIESIVSYFPAPLLIIRSLKAEVAAGLPQGATDTLATIDSDWMTNGDWGVIHFVGQHSLGSTGTEIGRVGS